MAISTIDNSGISASAAISTSKLGTGAVLQVVNATYSTPSSTTSTSFVTTGLTASITPLFSTSKIFVLITVRANDAASSNSQNFAIYRNSTNITSSVGYANYSTGGVVNIMQTVQTIDSPSTTSSTSYTLYQSSGGSNVGIQTDGSNAFPASITLMEIAG